MTRPARSRRSRLQNLALAFVLGLALSASTAGSTFLQARQAQARFLLLAAGVLCAPGSHDAPGPGGHHQHTGDCCCPATPHGGVPGMPQAHPDLADPPAELLAMRPAQARVAHPAETIHIDARAPPFLG